MGGYSWEDSRDVSPERYLSTVLAPGRPLVKQREGSALLGCMISVLCLMEREAAHGQEGEWRLCEAADNVDRYTMTSVLRSFSTVVSLHTLLWGGRGAWNYISYYCPSYLS